MKSLPNTHIFMSLQKRICKMKYKELLKERKVQAAVNVGDIMIKTNLKSRYCW